MSFFLAIMISFGLVITIMTEIQTKSTSNNQTENEFSAEIEDKNPIHNESDESSNLRCTDFNIGRCANILIKCGFAFMLGGLISERRFIVLGKI